MNQFKDLRLLVVEDDVVLAEYLRRFFEEHQMDVAVAPDTYTAYRLLSDKKFDAVLLDVILPDLNGFELLNILQHQLLMSDKRIYLMSILTQMQIKELGYRFGAQDYFIKPFHPEEVLNKMKEDFSFAY